MVLRPCLDCGVPTARTRCPEHQSQYESRRPSRRVLGRYDTKWMRLVKIAKARQPWCSGYQRPPHASSDLTGDHRLPLNQGGKNVLSNVDVLCRACNSAKRDRLRVTVGIGASNL